MLARHDHRTGVSIAHGLRWRIASIAASSLASGLWMLITIPSALAALSFTAHAARNNGEVAYLAYSAALGASGVTCAKTCPTHKLIRIAIWFPLMAFTRYCSYQYFDEGNAYILDIVWGIILYACPTIEFTTFHTRDNTPLVIAAALTVTSALDMKYVCYAIAVGVTLWNQGPKQPRCAVCRAWNTSINIFAVWCVAASGSPSVGVAFMVALNVAMAVRQRFVTISVS